MRFLHRRPHPLQDTAHGAAPSRGRPLGKLIARISSALALCAFLLTSSAIAADGEDNFYQNKQLRLIVSTDAGGAYDTFARIVAPIMRDYIPGHPTVVVQNMPGASGLKTANYMAATAPRDGTVIASTHAAILTLQLTSPGNAAFETTKFNWLGSLTTDLFVGYVWHTAPIQSLADAMRINSVMGGVGIGSASTDYAIMAKEMFGLKFKVVSGYKASNDVKLAMERGEVDGTFANGWSSIQTAAPDWLRDDKIRIIVQHGFKKSPDLPDVPLFFDLARTEAERQALVFMLARQEAAKPYFAPPDVPKERLAILRRAFDATVRDPRFGRNATKAGLVVEDPLAGSELTALVAEVAQTPPDVVVRINRILGERR